MMPPFFHELPPLVKELTLQVMVMSPVQLE
jgi:hypothetical protein